MLVSIFQAKWVIYQGIWPFGPSKCEFPIGNGTLFATTLEGMAEMGPILVMVGGDTKRVQWLTHHVTSHWANAQVTTLRAGESAPLSRLISERTPDAVILQADFSNEALAATVINSIAQLLRMQPALHCILLAENGNEMSAVNALKAGAKDYLPLAQLTRDQLLAAVGEACAKRRIATQAAAMMANSENSTIIDVPGYSIVKEIATSNFSSVYLARSERLRQHHLLPLRIADLPAQLLIGGVVGA